MRAHAGHGSWPRGTGLALLLLCRTGAAQERLDCVLDSECPGGQCIDLVCVDAEGRPLAPSTAAPSAAAPVPPPPPEPVAPAPVGGDVAPEQPAAGLDAAAAAPDDAKPKKRRKRKKPPAPPEPEAAAVRAPVDPGAARNGYRTYAAPEEPEPVTQGKSYRGPLLASYIVPPIGLALAFSTSSAALGVAACFPPPIVHWAHGQTGKGFLALFLAPLAAGVGALVGGSGCNRGGSCTGSLVAGALVGYGAWVALDVGVQAFEKPAVATQGFGLGVLPVAGGRGVQVSGVF